MAAKRKEKVADSDLAQRRLKRTALN